MRSTDSEYQCVAGHKASRSKAETQAQGRDVVLQHSSTLRGEKEEGEVCVSGLGPLRWHLDLVAKSMWTPEHEDMR